MLNSLLLVKILTSFVVAVEFLDLSNTQLEGSVPTEVCGIVSSRNLSVLKADCSVNEPVECGCCSECL